MVIWKLRNYTCLEDLEGLSEAWLALHQSSVRPDISLSPDWIISWYKAFGARLKPHVIGVFKDEELVLVAPMHSSMQSFRLTSLVALQSSANGYSPSGGVVTSTQISKTDLRTAFALLHEENNFELYRFYKLPEEEAASVCSMVSDSNLLHSGMEAVMSTPMIDLRGDWESYLETRSRSLRKSMRRKLKRISQQSKVELEVGVPQGSDAPILEEIFRISAKSWKQLEGSDLESDDVARKFICELVDRFCRAGEVKVWLLKVDGLAIAYELHFQSGGTVFPIRADFDLDFAELSPGQVLLQLVLESLFKDKSTQLYDSCADDYEYLKSWAHYSTDFYTVDAFSTKLKPSLVYLAKYRVLPAYRRFKERFSYAA